MSSLSFQCVIAYLFSLALSQSDFTYIGQFKTENPSFVELLDISPDQSTNPLDLDLIVTNFAEFGYGNGVSAFPNIGKYLQNISNGISPPKTILADKTLTWPNFVYVSEDNIFPADTTLIVHDGFLTPFHSNGGVYALLINDSKPINLIRLDPKINGCYYHNSTQIDMNGDGLTDILLAQTCQTDHDNTGTLIWLEQPKTNPSTPKSWIPHSLVNGPDVLITTQPFNKDTILVYAAQFFTNELKYYYLKIGVDKPYIVNNTGVLIDDTIGPVYDVEIVDIFKNGKKQLLVNDHEANGSTNGVFLYEFPDDFPNSNSFVKHQIAANFNTSGGVGVGAPGFAIPFDLNVEKDMNIPFKIGVAGDGNFITWELSLMDQKTFKYEKEVIRSVGGTAGIMAFGDVNGDGWTEAFIPFYEDGIIYVYTANPNGSF
eukprot:284337_1